VTTPLTSEQILEIDRQHIWHPYSSFKQQAPLFAVESAKGVRISLTTGESLIDGMSSWWSALHGYNHPELNKAVQDQLDKMAHIMFGGFSHEAAAKLTKNLMAIAPAPLEHVFYSDSGSVSVEIAMKMAIQYWQAKQQSRTQFMTIRRGYHGDTFAAMSVCDPDTGMHSLFGKSVSQQIFAPAPRCRFDEEWDERDFDEFGRIFLSHKANIAAVILEPIVQGTGGMRFYSSSYLRRVREICSAHGVLLILDEIATGLGRTGKLFACEHADIHPDIMCLGKTLSAGYITLAATLCTAEVASIVCASDAGVFMHGPTFMANPLACNVASRSIELLQENNWEQQITALEAGLKLGLAEARKIEGVEDVRVLGGIGVIEMEAPVDLNHFQPICVKNGIWLRPFGKLIYMMPPYIISTQDLATLCQQTLSSIYAYLRKVS
jgi:adenosylmethionine-8-amino-7-oxononanoate aminotransferase